MFVVILIILFCAYSPVLQFDYLYHDDLYFFSSWNKENCGGFEQLKIYVSFYGRPLGGLIKCFYAMSFDTIPQAKYVRAFNIILLSAYIFLVFLLFRRYQLPKVPSLFAAILVAFLTSYQTPIAQISNAHHVISAIFVLLGLLVGLKIVDEDRNIFLQIV